MSSFIVAYLVECENILELLSERAMDIEQSIKQEYANDKSGCTELGNESK